MPAGKIIIAGAGIAGLTTALAFAGNGFEVEIFERSPKLEEVGAGLQLSPNATRILERMGVLARLLPLAVQPEAVILRDAGTLYELARVPLGRAAQARWGAPYLVVHRADLQRALLASVAEHRSIRLVTGATITGPRHEGEQMTARVEDADGVQEVSGALLVGADGVWSALRSLAGMKGRSRFTGELAWRTLVPSDSAHDGCLRVSAPPTSSRPSCITVSIWSPIRCMAAPPSISSLSLPAGASMKTGMARLISRS